ncbi:DUF397 domain-containing protein [Saccharothrix longispora]|uniref:DUF397 domain-containing protein n=1 Tax=Saccharothrix longispora TaxID=33920 RepID=UPI0028FD5695|nr:DUF397 domain-containing protein [Saccharothrix longispora]MDU0293933.1 DUF397 domain-containing protein [Saccharothrix longispora]
MEGATWRKSSRSNSSGGACIELACSGDLRGVRDSKNPTGPVLRFGQVRVEAFLNEIRTGRHDG